MICLARNSLRNRPYDLEGGFDDEQKPTHLEKSVRRIRAKPTLGSPLVELIPKIDGRDG